MSHCLFALVMASAPPDLAPQLWPALPAPTPPVSVQVLELGAAVLASSATSGKHALRPAPDPRFPGMDRLSAVPVEPAQAR